MVHFPIVLLLLGSAMAWVTVLIPRGTWARIAAACLVWGAAGAVVAGQTGEHEGESAQTPWGSKGTLKTHEEWAERTQVAALAVAGLAIGVLAMRRWPMIARTMAIATAVGALASTWCVIATGHYFTGMSNPPARVAEARWVAGLVGAGGNRPAQEVRRVTLIWRSQFAGPDCSECRSWR